MLKKGDILTNPKTNESLTVLATSADTKGEFFLYEGELAPNVPVEPMHLHPKAIEIVKVIKGTLSVKMNGQVVDYSEGQSFTIDINIPHTAWNSGTSKVVAVCEIRPAMEFERYFETVFDLMKNGKCNKKGIPNIFRLSVILNDLYNHIYLPHMVTSQKVVFYLLSRIGLLLGYKTLR